MKIEYEVTLEEMTITNYLWIKGAGALDKWRAYGVLYWLIGMGAIVYLIDGSWTLKVIVGFILGGVLGGRMVFQPEVLIKNRIRKAIKQKLQDNLPVNATVELSAEEISFQTESSTVIQKLAALCTLENEEDGIVLTFSNKEIMYIPTYAFANEEEQEQWQAQLSLSICNNPK